MDEEPAADAVQLSRRLSETADLVMFRHTVFALPFAIMGLISAAGDAWPTLRTWLWIGVAMVTARTAAMAFNRLVDHRIDAANPRTAGRALPAGRLSRTYVWALVIVCCIGFMVAAAELNRLCLVLAPATLAILLGYSFAKRFTVAAHVWLGVALGLAPVGAWIAVRGDLDWQPLVLGAAVSLWVAGFDIIYSLQDEEFDRRRGLNSLPARLGAARALMVSRGLHLGALVGFGAFAAAVGGGPWRVTAVAAAAILIVLQHTWVRPGELSRVNAAFFTANGMLSILMCALFLFAKMQAGP